ncbi:uncharacterized protein KY384_000269 [Bacidia gigantensis]|uniref:uncharacterized protein n=1 Tax=Bacidia gigantensis TaxID=2732470 RepID=UPI001D0504E3|nr:uncharacterized protein KY384_000269 [Bacidia gigantensis]KAG8526276.1 hypothetical protein KY384_000269 [Bacidia gigantensis]
MRRAYPTLELETWDDEEEDRLEHVGLVKGRGKGAPKKKKGGPEESKKTKKKQPAVASVPKDIKF